MKFILFGNKRELDAAYRDAALSACKEWIPILEKGIENSKRLIQAYANEIGNRKRPFNGQKFLLIFWERRQLQRKEYLLGFFRDQEHRLTKYQDLPMIMTMEEYRKDQIREDATIQ